MVFQFLDGREVKKKMIGPLARTQFSCVITEAKAGHLWRLRHFQCLMGPEGRRRRKLFRKLPDFLLWLQYLNLVPAIWCQKATAIFKWRYRINPYSSSSSLLTRNKGGAGRRSFIDVLLMPFNNLVDLKVRTHQNFVSLHTIIKEFFAWFTLVLKKLAFV